MSMWKDPKVELPKNVRIIAKSDKLSNDLWFTTLYFSHKDKYCYRDEKGILRYISIKDIDVYCNEEDLIKQAEGD